MVRFWRKNVSIGVRFLFASQKDDSESEDERNCSYAGAMVGFWKKKVSIGVQFLFASQKDDSESGEQGICSH
ncbi:hypothetical protein [Sphingobacterium sp.]|uniref:hypothetical protein n=1 Tax=Sphingobacterium sp. TaxID=341027 RepID=UPI0028B205E7|nr:hypothetical protein [Sphingobacterium sp.]